MPRTLLCLATLAAFSVPSRADPTIPSTETVITLTVQPMAAPKPALRYLLLPELSELSSGNPIQGYLRCFGERQSFQFNKEACERRDQLQPKLLTGLSTQELQDHGKLELREADWAARLDKPDWQILLHLKTDGISLLLPDLQLLRTLAVALKERFRTEVATHRFDDALRTAKTLFAMSRHMSEHPTLIGDLVGIAIAYSAIGPLEEMLEQPGCPNLYWALTNLPSPLVCLVKGMEGERVLIAGEFRDLDAHAPMSADQLRKLIAHIDQVRGTEQKPGQPEWGTRARLNALTRDETAVQGARRRLVEFGLPEERLQRFPADQIILLEQMKAHDVRRDEVMKLTPLPTWQIEAMAGSLKPDKEEGLFGFLLPGLSRIYRAQGRLEQRIALLRHIEALRLYAADHDAKLPAKLADISVPLPPDPFTGKPFRYHVDGATAHLRGSPPPGEEKDASLNVHYQVTIQK